MQNWPRLLDNLGCRSGLDAMHKVEVVFDFSIAATGYVGYKRESESRLTVRPALRT